MEKGWGEDEKGSISTTYLPPPLYPLLKVEKGVGCHEEVIDLMGHACDQVSERPDFYCLYQLGLAGRELLG